MRGWSSEFGGGAEGGDERVKVRQGEVGRNGDGEEKVQMEGAGRVRELLLVRIAVIVLDGREGDGGKNKIKGGRQRNRVRGWRWMVKESGRSTQ